MRLRAKRPRIYQSISSAFSRKSSSSPESPPSQSTPSHLPAVPTAGNLSLLSISTGRSQRIYQSISSAFSRHTSPMQDLPEICSSTPAQSLASNPLPIPPQSEAECIVEPDWGNLKVMEEVEDQYNGDHCPRHNEEINNKTDHAQLPSESESNGPSREAEAPVKAAKGAYVAVLTIKEVRSAHADLQNILKP